MPTQEEVLERMEQTLAALKQLQVETTNPTPQPRYTEQNIDKFDLWPVQGGKYFRLTPEIFELICRDFAEEHAGRLGVDVILHSRRWHDILTNTQFSAWIDPVTRRDIVASGYVGSMLGCDLYTDGFFAEDERFIPDDIALYIVIGPKGE